MRNRWIVPTAVALLSLALVLIWSQMASQALVPLGDSEAARAAGLRAPAAGSQAVHEATLDRPTGEAGRLVTVDGVSLEKTASSTSALPGGVVTYTLTFSNSGVGTKSLDLVGDVLPQDVTYKRMTGSSDIQTDPLGTGTIVWPGPLNIDPLADLVVEYEVTMPLISDTVTLVNEAWGQMNSTTVGPDSVEVELGWRGWTYLPAAMRKYAPPRFSVTKTADPSVVFNTVPEAVFTYTVGFFNEGSVPGVLADIRDTLPAGFEFDRMVIDQSDIDSPPVGTTGEIVWTGPFTVPGESTLTLVYKVTSPPIIGAYANSATATTVEGKGAPPETPGQAIVHITEPIHLEEDWQGSISEHWRPYLNHGKLAPEQWFIVPNEGSGYSAALKHTRDAGGKVANDALYMYYDPAAEGWRDYRYEAKVNISKGQIAGLWFRGKVEEPDPGPDPKHDEGYYFVMSPSGWVKLGAVSHDAPFYPYYFDNVREIRAVAYTINRGWWYTLAVEVSGNRIKCYVDGNLVIDEYDSTYSTGTVGMKTYRVDSGVWDDILVTALP